MWPATCTSGNQIPLVRSNHRRAYSTHCQATPVSIVIMGASTVGVPSTLLCGDGNLDVSGAGHLQVKPPEGASLDDGDEEEGLEVEEVWFITI